MTRIRPYWRHWLCLIFGHEFFYCAVPTSMGRFVLAFCCRRCGHNVPITPVEEVLN